jgi:5-methylcytosine-specific restriction endonuclease McrA
MASSFVCDDGRQTQTCVVCGTGFSYERIGNGTGRLRTMCSETCRKTRSIRELVEVPCLACGVSFLPRRLSKRDYPEGQRHCSIACSNERFRLYPDALSQRRAEEHRRRARIRGGKAERFTGVSIFERDGWMCGICQQPVDPALKFPDHYSASLDHIRPLSKGGAHTAENCQCSHWICNSRKTNMLFRCEAA